MMMFGGLQPVLPADCAPIGTALTVAVGGGVNGDMDCDGDVDLTDAMILLRHIADLAVVLPDGCPPIG